MTNEKRLYSGRKGLTARVLILALLLLAAGAGAVRAQKTMYSCNYGNLDIYFPLKKT